MVMKKCPNGHPVGDNMKFCPKCGVEIVEDGPIMCAKCGNERKGSEKFCPKCGTPYDHISTNYTAVTDEGHDEPSKKRVSKKSVIIAAVVAIIVQAGGALWYFMCKEKYSLEGLAKAVINYDDVRNFHDGLASVGKDGKYGFIDKMGNEVIPCIYEYPQEEETPSGFLEFHEGMAIVYKDDKYFFINKEGKECFSSFDIGGMFSEGLAFVDNYNNKSGYIDKEGNMVITLEDGFYGKKFHDGMAAIVSNGKFGFIDKKGNIVIPVKYEVGDENYTADFTEGLSPICNDVPYGEAGKYSFIDKSGKEVISGSFTYASNFYEGLAAVFKDDKWGYVDKKGKEVIPFMYNVATRFSEGYAIVGKDGEYMQIDKKGKTIKTYRYSKMGSFVEGLAVVFSDELYGYIDVNGNEVIPCIYESPSWNDYCFSEGLAVVKKDGVYGFVDKKGNSTFDVQDEEVKKLIQAKKEEIKRIEEENYREEQRRVEEERKRIEEERRRGVDKIVTLSCERDEKSHLVNCYGSYGVNYYYGMWRYCKHLMSDPIQIPYGKVWIYEKSEGTPGVGDIYLLYYSRESGARYDNIKIFDKDYILSHGDIPILRSGDKIVIAFYPFMNQGTKSIKVYFKEKDEDVVN